MHHNPCLSKKEKKNLKATLILGPAVCSLHLKDGKAGWVVQIHNPSIQETEDKGPQVQL